MSRAAQILDKAEGHPGLSLNDDRVRIGRARLLMLMEEYTQVVFVERLREELIKYNTYLYEHNYTDSDIWAEEPNPADEYIKSKKK